MILRYIYVKEYKDLLKTMDINLGGKNIFKMNNKTLEVYGRNEEYVDIFKDINYVNDISAIIGKNSSGKTTILRMINLIFDEYPKEIKFLCVFEEDGKHFCYSNYIKNDEIKIEVKNTNTFKIKCIGKEEYSHKISKYSIIYASSIFDKTSCFSDHNKLHDISTNNLLRQFINDNNLKQRAIKAENLDLIDEFRKSEVEKKVKYFIALDKLKQEQNDMSFSEIFDFPQCLEMEISYDIDELDNLLNDASEMNEDSEMLIKSLDFKMREYEYLPEKITEDIKNVVYKSQFAFIVMYEVLIKISTFYKADIEDVIKNYLNLVSDDLASLDIMGRSNLVLDSILKRKKREAVNKNEDYNISTITTVTKYTNYINIYENLLYDIDNRIEEIENYDIHPDNIYDQITQLFNDISDVHESTYPELLEVLKDTEIMSTTRKIKEEIDDFKNRYLLGESQVTEIEEFYDENSEGLVNLLEVLQDIHNYLGGIVVYITDYINKIEVENIDGEGYEEDYIEENKEVIEYVKKIKELFKKLTLLMKSSKVIIKEDGEYVTLSCEWTNTDLKEFLTYYKELDLNIVEFVFSHEDISTGHNAYLDIFSRIASEIDRIDKKKNEVLLLLDEADVFLHPEVQIKYLNNLLQFLQLFLKGRNIQVIITSNSPFIISDLAHTNLIYLDEMKISTNSNDSRTLGANIHELLANNFFMKDGVVGEFAKIIINKIIENINKKQDKEYTRKLIQVLGEPIIRNKLQFMYDRAFIESVDDVQEQIDECIKRLEFLNKLKEREV